MPETAITVQTIDHTGLAATYGAPDDVNGNSFVNDGRTIFHVKVATGTATGTIAAASTGKCSQGFAHDVAISVADSTEEFYGPFLTTEFGSTVLMSWSSITGTTVAALKVPHTGR